MQILFNIGFVLSIGAGVVLVLYVLVNRMDKEPWEPPSSPDWMIDLDPQWVRDNCDELDQRLILNE